jgi:hypothetical protein
VTQSGKQDQRPNHLKSEFDSFLKLLRERGLLN